MRGGEFSFAVNSPPPPPPLALIGSELKTLTFPIGASSKVLAFIEDLHVPWSLCWVAGSHAEQEVVKKVLSNHACIARNPQEQTWCFSQTRDCPCTCMSRGTLPNSAFANFTFDFHKCDFCFGLSMFINLP